MYQSIHLVQGEVFVISAKQRCKNNRDKIHRDRCVGSLVCRQSVVHVPMILGKNCFRCALMRWVRTTPSFLFCDSPWLRHRVLHNGSSCQLLDGKPMAATLTLGYFASKDLNLVTKVLLGLMVCKK